MGQLLAFTLLRVSMVALEFSREASARILLGPTSSFRPFRYRLSKPTNQNFLYTRSQTKMNLPVPVSNQSGLTTLVQDLVVDLGGSPWVVIVDEDTVIRSAIEAYLVQRGFLCDTFASVEAALRGTAGKPMPDLIITEVEVAGRMSGLDLLQYARLHVPVILLTVHSTPQDRIVGYRTGASAYITKPFIMEELEDVVKSVIQKSKLSSLTAVAPLEYELKSLRRDMNNINEFIELLVQNGMSMQDEPDERRSLLGKQSTAIVLARQSAALDTNEKIRLTQTELAVLQCLYEGLPNKLVARKLSLSVSYVEKVILKLFGPTRKHV